MLDAIKAPVLLSLRELGIGGVRIKYSGSGDSGQIDDVFYVANFAGLAAAEAEKDEMVNPFVTLVEQTSVVIPVETQHFSDKRQEWMKRTNRRQVTLREALEHLFNAALDATGNSGYGNNEGGQGHLDIDTQAGTLHLHHEDNITTTQESEYDL